MSDTATATHRAQLMLVLTDRSRELLQLMNFGDVPENATHLAFFPDGNAQFLELNDGPRHPGSPLPIIPSMILVTAHKDVDLILPNE